MRIKTLIIFLPLLCIILFASCSEDQITDSVSGNRNAGIAPAGTMKEPGEQDSVLERGVTPSGKAYVVLSRWVLDHYEAAPGMIVGTWPREERYLRNTLGDLHYKWGFNYILVRDFNEKFYQEGALAAGFPESKMMAAVAPGSYERTISFYGERVYGYYCDEPADRNFNFDTINTYKKQKAPSNLLLISGYKRTTVLDSFVRAADGVGFSSYAHWYLFFGFWVSWPENPDQREDWTDMQKRYGSKYTFSWIGAHMDLLEYEQLLQHAKLLGLKNIWLYQLQDETDDLSDANVSIFALYAWKNGFLNRFERKEILRLENALSDESLPNGTIQKGSWKVTESRSTKQLRRVPPEQFTPDIY